MKIWITLIVFTLLTGCAILLKPGFSPGFSPVKYRNPSSINPYSEPFSYFIANTYHTTKAFPHPTHSDLCLRYVKCSLLEAGIINKYLPGLEAKNFDKTLNSYPQFKRLGNISYYQNNRKQIPQGAVIIYHPGPENKNFGHVEIKVAPTGRRGFASNFYHDGITIGYIKAIFMPTKSFTFRGRIYSTAEKRKCRIR